MNINEQADANLRPVAVSLTGLDIYTPDSPGMILEGFYWREPWGKFRRLPEDIGLFGVDYESWNTAGGCVRFASDTKKIVLHAEVTGCRSCNMSCIGAMGFDLYGNPPGKPPFFLQSTIFPIEQNEYSCTLYSSELSALHEFTIYFPLYSGVKTLEIGLSPGASLQTISPRRDRRSVVLYGTSITQGCGSSRPGMLYSNILGRLLNAGCLNFGFSGSGRGEAQVAEKISEVENPSLFILDYDTNAGPEELEKTLLNFIAILRKRHPLVPIVVLSAEPKPDEMYALTAPCPHREERREFDRIHRQAQAKLAAAGDGNVYFLDGMTLYGEDYPECCVDSLHSNDLGNYRLAHTLASFVNRNKLLDHRGNFKSNGILI